MEALYSTLLLAIFAFWLGACPFSLWIGKWLLCKDIRNYGDGNPGGLNVFRAGGRKAFVLALILDAGKGVPFVALSYLHFGLPEVAAMAVGLSAILGSAFSPILQFKGGKSIGITFGVLFALPQHEILISFAILTFLAFLLIDVDAWRVILGTSGSLAYLVATSGSPWEPLFMLCVLTIFAVKHFNDLQVLPRFKGKLISWLQSRKTLHLSQR